jgi:hypothetical protein
MADLKRLGRAPLAVASVCGVFSLKATGCGPLGATPRSARTDRPSRPTVRPVRPRRSQRRGLLEHVSSCSPRTRARDRGTPRRADPWPTSPLSAWPCASPPNAPAPLTPAARQALSWHAHVPRFAQAPDSELSSTRAPFTRPSACPLYSALVDQAPGARPVLRSTRNLRIRQRSDWSSGTGPPFAAQPEVRRFQPIRASGPRHRSRTGSPPWPGCARAGRSPPGACACECS